MYRDCPHRSEKLRIVHNVQQADAVEDMSINVPRIYAVIENKQDGFQSHMIEVEGKINNQTISILIDLGSIHSYIDPKMVERLHLPRNKLGKSWLVKLAIEAKRKNNEIVKECLRYMNGKSIMEYLNITPLGSYDCIIGMDWLEQYHSVLDYYNKTFT
jgi:hypothetical protein